MPVQLYDLVGKDPDKPFSPHCWKVRMALAHKGILFEQVPVRFTEVPNIENGGYEKIPVIRHGDEVISDSFEIALYLKDRYPDLGRYLFKGDGSVGLTRFIENWTQAELHTWIGGYVLMDLMNMLDEKDQNHFRTSREARFGKSLEEVVEGREARVDDLLNHRLLPLRMMLKGQDFIGGDSPLFADYIVFGALQWLRVVSGLHMIPDDDPVKTWFNRCLALHDGVGASVEEANPS